jgi:hypothetical protein
LAAGFANCSGVKSASLNVGVGDRGLAGLFSLLTLGGLSSPPEPSCLTSPSLVSFGFLFVYFLFSRGSGGVSGLGCLRGRPTDFFPGTEGWGGSAGFASFSTSFSFSRACASFLASCCSRFDMMPFLGGRPGPLFFGGIIGIGSG